MKNLINAILDRREDVESINIYVDKDCNAHISILPRESEPKYDCDIKTGTVFFNNDGIQIGTMYVLDREDLCVNMSEVTEVIVKETDDKEYRFTPGPVDGTVRFEEVEKKPMTQKEYMNKVLPNHAKDSIGLHPKGCPKLYGLKNHPECTGYNYNRCIYCWNQPMEE